MLDFLTAPQSELDALDRKDTRSGFGQGLLEVGHAQENVVALCADLTGSLKMNAFQNAFPDRFKQAGIAEANMIGVAAGMTIGGLVPFTGTFANSPNPSSNSPSLLPTPLKLNLKHEKPRLRKQ